MGLSTDTSEPPHRAKGFTLLEGGARDPLFVESLAKGLAVLEAFYDESDSLGLSEIAAKTGLGKSAAQRFCHTLGKLGLLEKDERSRRLRPSRRLLDFSFMFLHGNPLVAIATPFVVRLHEEVGEATNFALPIDTDVMYVIRLPSPDSPVPNPAIGGRAPMFCTASGRAYLSALDAAAAMALIDASDRKSLTPRTITDREAILQRVAEGRESGYTLADQECITGELTVAAPVRGRDSMPMGAINICVSTPTWSIAQVRSKLAPKVTRAALDISRALGVGTAG
ncbi:IclR family transcriptional regulator C-terminal domain-containing protein [Pelagibius sp. CAU 1746]|uniref:IclR family transcriptional regulator n=1 Tax=Pelagibius sp. CAU 1746 TaxID=3140370 RepID=UPI00325A555D